MHVRSNTMYNINITHLLTHEEACESQPSQDEKDNCCSGNDNKITPPPQRQKKHGRRCQSLQMDPFVLLQSFLSCSFFLQSTKLNHFISLYFKCCYHPYPNDEIYLSWQQGNISLSFSFGASNPILE